MNPFAVNALICARYFLRKRRNRRRRRYHVHPILVERLLEGEFCKLFSRLQEDEEKFFDYFKMSIRSFDELQARLHDILKHSNMFRAPVQPIERLAVTLRYFVTGETFKDLHFSYRLGASTIGEIIKEVCKKIWTLLHEECLSIPNSQEGWLRIAAGFENTANFPNCIGCIDGKHVRIICPKYSGSLYSNYKKFYSIVLLAMCDCDYRYTYINVGAYGTDSDSNIFRRSSLFTKLHNGEIILPPPKPLPHTTEPLPYMIIGDAAFGISNKILRPYARSNLTHKKKIFNYRLSRARRYIESTFGIMSNKFKIFHRPMNTSLPNTIAIIKACCLLHNYIRERDGYRIQDTLTVLGFDQSLNTNSNNSRSGDTIRDKFSNYFVSPAGSVPWQDTCIF
ncbi:protein ALP1-like [Spodoptera litura]|uniref:Protein ALP1-like n=1 Tax=Spodoptera litura TaxID=69820 RepID=A0A9J7EQZ9_SPOLT|nr:protein ALP1-like [Spodoptera litura]XP_022835508.1 protein ALP1-like [Spodoptera litura]XP_022835509.1 protein ALP1-like [Spodoptera litura]